MRLGIVVPLFFLGCVSDAPVMTDSGVDTGVAQDGQSLDAGGDAANGNDAADGGPWTPNAFGNDLALWLLGDVGVVQAAMVVAEWKDQSPQPISLTQVDTMKRPTVEKGVANGHDVINFTTGGMALYSPDTVAKLQFGMSDDFVIGAVVAEVPSGNFTESNFIFAKATHTISGWTDGIMFGIHLTDGASELPDFRLSNASNNEWVVGNSLSDHNYHCVVARRVGATNVQMRTDMLVKNKVVSSFDVSETQVPLGIGSILLPMQTAMGSFAFRVAEVVVAHRAMAISDAEVANLEGYLRAKYKTP